MQNQNTGSGSGTSQLGASTSAGAGQAKSQIGASSSAVAGQAKEIARTSTRQVKQIGEEARGRALREINTRRQGFASEVEKLAGTLESQSAKSEGAGPILDLAATAARRLSATLNDHSAEELLRTVSRNPVAILAGTFALGFFATRLFKA